MLRHLINLQIGILLPPGARGEGTGMCPALRSEEGGGSRMRVRAERCTSLLRSARTLTPTPLPEGEGITSSFQVGTLLPPGEGGGSRMRVRAERCTSRFRFARTLTPTPLPEGEGITSSFQVGTLLPPGEGGGSRMRVRPERCTSPLRSARTLTPSPGGRGASTRNAYWQVGNLNDASRVFQLNEPVVFRYSLVYQNVQSSTGSTVIAL